jgi:pyrroloquinoline-quinone synthase
MSNDVARFVGALRSAIEARRTFGKHPLWLRIRDGALSRDDVALWAVQFFLQVREFPRAVSALHSKCTAADERVDLAESLYEEETGRLSGCNVSHPELFIRFGEGLGLQRADMVSGTPLPETQGLIDWFELSTKERSFVEGAAAINLASEGQVPGAFAPLARALEKHYGLTREQVAFWDIHEQADSEHSDVGSNIVIRFASSEEVRSQALAALNQSLAKWWHFFDGIERSIALR